MNLLHITTDTKRFAKGKLPPLALLVILLLPLLFGGMFVWAYWEPGWPCQEPARGLSQ